MVLDIKVIYVYRCYNLLKKFILDLNNCVILKNLSKFMKNCCLKMISERYPI